jgi:thymidylate synthase
VLEKDMETIDIGKVIQADTISDAWYKSLKEIWNHGSIITDERGSQIRELLNLMVVVENPYIDSVPKEVSLTS